MSREVPTTGRLRWRTAAHNLPAAHEVATLERRTPLSNIRTQCEVKASEICCWQSLHFGRGVRDGRKKHPTTTAPLHLIPSCVGLDLLPRMLLAKPGYRSVSLCHMCHRPFKERKLVNEIGIGRRRS